VGDANCIDQKRNDERNHQVQLMKHIYLRAQTVLICYTKSYFQKLGSGTSRLSILQGSSSRQECLGFVQVRFPRWSSQARILVAVMDSSGSHNGQIDTTAVCAQKEAIWYQLGHVEKRSWLRIFTGTCEVTSSRCAQEDVGLERCSREFTSLSSFHGSDSELVIK
jgi:hypothetical protein